jgi:hypothetical protein
MMEIWSTTLECDTARGGWTVAERISVLWNLWRASIWLEEYGGG